MRYKQACDVISSKREDQVPGGGCDALKPALMKGGGPYPGGGMPMVKVGGTRPTAPGTAWATGSWWRDSGRTR